MSQLLKVDEVMQRLNCGERLVRKLMASGDLEVVRLGAGPRPRVRITEESVGQYVERQTVRATPAPVIPARGRIRLIGG